MSKTKVHMVGILRLDAHEGLQFSLHIAKSGKTLWLEANLPNGEDWPGLGKRPERPLKPQTGSFSRSESRAERDARWADERVAREKWQLAEEAWKRASLAYDQALHADPHYKQEAEKFIESQRHEPQELFEIPGYWAYRDKILQIESDEPTVLRDRQSDILSIKHFVLRRERTYEKVKREVEALENMEKLEGVTREPIPDNVRLFVWQRDKGQCVKCRSRERLEFDHIIPIVAGGSNTERNIQLLCEICNRSKGSRI